MSNARKLGNMTTHGLDGDFNVDPTDNTLVVDSTNNRVGIGSATPTTTLDITGTATATAFSGPLTGNVTGTTSSISNHDTDALSEGSTNLYFTNARADARAQLKIDALVDSAPGTLDTLNELAAALGDDASFSTTVTNSIATKLPLAGGTLTGSLDVNSFQRILANNALFFMNTNNSASSYLKNTLGAGAADLRLGVMGDDKVTILSNGNVGIGRTPESHYTGYTALDLGHSSSLFGNKTGSDTNVVILANNSYLNSTASAWKYIVTDEATKYEQSNGKHRWFHASSGTAGTDVTWTNSLAIDESGNVGIGTASPTSLLNLQKTRNGAISGGSSDTGAVIKLHTEAQWESGYGNNPAASTNDYLGSIEFSTGDSSTGEGVRAAIRATVDSYYNQNSIVFETATGATAVSPIERMRVLHNGNVGIGTADPNGKLTVALENSNTPAFRLASPTSSTDFAISNYNDANGTYVSMGVNHLFDVSGNDAVMDTNDKSAAIVLDGRNNGRIQFLTNSSGIATPRMTITQDGDVGIGATNPGGSRLYLQDTHTTAVTNAATMIANTTLTINGNSSQGSDVMRMGPMSTSGKHFIDVSNSAGNAAYDLLLNPISGGNVGIGITNAAQLLHVQAGSTGNGTIRVGGGAGLEISHDNSSTTIQRIDSLYRTTSANANLQLRTGILTAHIGTASTEAMRLDGANGLQVITDSSNGTTADNVSIRYNGTAGGHQSGYLFKDKRNVVNAAIKNDLQDDGVGTAAAHLRFQTSHGGTLTTQMTIDRYGQVMMPNQPSFRAYSTNDYTANGTLESANWTEQHDNNGDFSNGRFTAPVDGVYLFEVMWDANGSLGGLSLLKNTSYYLVRWEPTGLSTAGWESRHYSTTVKLSSGDYVRLVGVHASGSNPFHMGGGHWGFFSGHLLG